MGFFIVVDSSIILIISLLVVTLTLFLFLGYIIAGGEFGFRFQALQASYRPTHYYCDVAWD